MACYYFHFTDGKRLFKDAAGVELQDVVAARQEAIRCAQVLMAPQPDDLQALDWTAWKVIVATERSTIVELPFADLVGEPAPAASSPEQAFAGTCAAASAPAHPALPNRSSSA